MDAVERMERVFQRAQDQLNYADKVQAREAALDRDDLRTLLSLARGNGWQDIATAERAETDVLLFDPSLYGGYVTIGAYHSGQWRDQRAEGYSIQPTDWQPLPEPPLDHLRGSEDV